MTMMAVLVSSRERAHYERKKGFPSVIAKTPLEVKKLTIVLSVAAGADVLEPFVLVVVVTFVLGGNFVPVDDLQTALAEFAVRRERPHRN